MDASLLGLMRNSIVSLVQRDGADLTARQFAVLMECYLDDEPQTVRGMAAKLNVSKPAISRALDRLEVLDLIKRVIDPLDRRSIIAKRTPGGINYMRDLDSILRKSAVAAGISGYARPQAA